MDETILLAILFFAVATLYGSVGHAGASGYLAVMALVGVAPERMKPTALVLNIVVATIATLNFRRAGVFYPRQVLPFALTSVPLAFVGGAVHPTATWYRPLVAVVLVAAAARAVFRSPPSETSVTRSAALSAAAETGSRESASAFASSLGEPRVPWPAALACGAVIGLLAGLTGTGGGIFLSPLLVVLGWATVRQSAGLSALVILVNSIAGLAGNATAMPTPSVQLAVLAGAAGAGGFLGSSLGASRLPERPMSGLLAVVLIIAAAKLALT